MQILVRDPYYGAEDDKFEDDPDKFYREMKAEFDLAFPEGKLTERDAGPSASIPALLFEIGTAALVLYSAPQVIAESTKTWKALFDKVAGFFASKRLDFSIDYRSARNVATFYALNSSSGTFETFGFTYAIRHWANLNGTNYEVLRLDDNWPKTSDIEIHTEAVRQLWCRYIFGAHLDGAALTIVIEKDGSCSYIRKL